MYAKGGVTQTQALKDIIGLAMGLASIRENSVMGNVMKGMRSVVLHVSVQTMCNIIKIVMDDAFQQLIMKETTGIVMGHAHPKISHVMVNAIKGMYNVAINV